MSFVYFVANTIKYFNLNQKSHFFSALSTDTIAGKMMLIRAMTTDGKISIGSDYKNDAMHYSTGQPVYGGHEICNIIFNEEENSYVIFIKKNDEVIVPDLSYVSAANAVSYIGAKYIKSKSEDIFTDLCSLSGIPPELVEANEAGSGGAQYLMKGINAQFWANVEKDCERLFKEITDINNEKKAANPSYHELQIWCSDMFAVLWNGWKLGYESICHPDLEFSWATSTEADWDRLNIFHNAGVTDAAGGLFYKAIYMNELPYNRDLKINEGTASKKYYEIIIIS